MRLSDRIAIVTGGASGIGLASTRRLLEEGAAVVQCDVDAAAGERAIADLTAQGLARVAFVQADEVAAVVAFLASDDASVITGALIPIDGGYSAG